MIYAESTKTFLLSEMELNYQQYMSIWSTFTTLKITEMELNMFGFVSYLYIYEFKRSTKIAEIYGHLFIKWKSSYFVSKAIMIT